MSVKTSYSSTFRELCDPRKWLRRGLNLLYPPHCSFCGDIFAEEAFEPETWTQICPPCRKKLVPQNKTPCRRCGAFFPAESGRERRSCVHCSADTHYFKRTVSFGEYADDLREAILRMKEETNGHLATAIASLFGRIRGDELRALEPDYLVPVPMHFARRIVRGVNGPEFLAEELGRRLKIPVLGGIVARTRATTVQYELTPRQRAANVKNAFVLKSNFALRIRRIEPRKRLEGKKILLTDDILTTGSTVDELARLLLAGGAASVDVCVLARAVGDRGNER